MRSETTFNQAPQFEAAVPCVFGGTVGQFMPASKTGPVSAAAVLFLSPWGFEELSSHRFFRAMAEAFSEQGLPSLRFDYPGTGDALDDADFETGLELWENSIRDAAMHLFQRSHYRQLVLVGQGVGALLASRMANELSGFHSAILINTPVTGRHYLRELAIWSTTIDNNLELRPEQRDRSPGAIAGFSMPEAIARDIRNFKLADMNHFSAARLLLVQPDAENETVANTFRAAGAAPEILPFAYYPDMVSNVTISRIPRDIVRSIAEWGSAGHREASPERLPDTPQLRNPVLHGDSFCETPVRFGPGNLYSGMLCEPLGGHGDTAVVFFTTAYERHISWGRQHLLLARQLARAGIASFRFDTASVGDSADRAGVREQVLYSDDQQADAAAALDYISGRGVKNIVAVGRCSGAYLAFQTAVHDPRVRGLVAVNPDAFFWPQDKSVDELLEFVPRLLGSYLPKIFSLETLQRMVKGEIKIGAAMRNMTELLLQQAASLLEPVIVLDREQWQIRQNSRLAFDMLAARNVAFSLMFSEGDVGIRNLRDVFGAQAKTMSAYPNIDLRFIGDCDHNMTPPHARAHYLASIMAVVDMVQAEKLTDVSLSRSGLKTRKSASGA